MSDPLIGRTLGKYLVQQAIGRGGMARVYRASDMVLQRSVALKVLTPALSADPDFAKRFEREAITAANLRHPAIVTIFDVGEADGLRYIAMEYISGRTLEDVLREQRRLDLPLSTAILDPVADALDFAHAAGMVHRDIKPHNILLDTDGRVVLTDFGIAIDPSEAGDRLTRTGTFMGTPEYISPEQAQAQPLTGSSDLYSLGIVAYEMLAGRVPFEGGTPQQIMAHVYQTPPLVSSVDPSQPSELDPIFARMLSKDPVQRFDKAGSFVAALRSVLQQGNMPPATREDIARLAVAADSSAGQATIAATGVPLPPADANAASPPGSAAPGMAGAAAAAGLAGQGSAAANQAYAATPPGGVQPPTGQNIRQPTGQGYSYAGGGDQFVPPPRVPRRRFYEDEGGSVPWMLLAAGAVGLVAITLVVLLSRPSGGSGGNPFVATSTATVTATETVLPSPSPEPSPSSGPSPSAVPFPTLTLVPLTPDPSEVPPPPTAEPPTAEPPTAEPPTGRADRRQSRPRRLLRLRRKPLNRHSKLPPNRRSSRARNRQPRPPPKLHLQPRRRRRRLPRSPRRPRKRPCRRRRPPASSRVRSPLRARRCRHRSKRRLRRVFRRRSAVAASSPFLKATRCSCAISITTPPSRSTSAGWSRPVRRLCRRTARLCL